MFPLATLRIEILEKQLTQSLITMLQDIYDPYKVRLMLNQTDIENYSTIDLMAKLQLHRVMQTNVTDRVIKDTWNSRVDVSGSVFENSTAYNFLFTDYFKSKEDFEEKRRFYQSRDLTIDVRPHRFSYRVWLQSMSLRYFIEMTFFAISVLVFQYFLS